MEKLIALSQQAKEVIIFVPSPFRKYMNLIKKKVLSPMGIESSICDYTAGKLIGINGRLREFVETNYDMNRKAFNAYGSYLSHIEKHQNKRIFRTELVNVDTLAKSFGFSVAPRVKTGKFLKESIRK